MKNPFSDALNEAIESSKYHAETIGKAARLLAFMSSQNVPEEVMKTISSINVYTDSLYINLSDKSKGSHAPIGLTKIFGDFKKTPSLDGKSLTLTASLPQDHPSGLRFVSISGYLPDTCKLVQERVPISEDLKKQYEDMIQNGAVRFKTVCGEEEEIKEEEGVFA